MAYDWGLFMAEVKAAVASAWPEVVPIGGGSGIYELEEIARISWEEPPEFTYAVLSVDPAETGEWGLVNIAPEQPIGIHYLTTWYTSLEILRARLEAVKAALLATAFTAATLHPDMRFDTSRQHEANAIFLQKGVDYAAASLSVRFVIGESAF